ncbi:hypothetical protein CSB20_09010 [bacterium DOLZORAL124_64_63]|nr:MAG: hypothetical protein CSB20_09010 [bacterium DOLZORAL124_64_63]
MPRPEKYRPYEPRLWRYELPGGWQVLAGKTMRATAYLVGNMLHWHMGTALVWGLPFLIYGIRYQRILRSPRADGLPG